MYDQDIPEQLIKEVTDHRSEAVCVYKRTSDHLREVASKTLGPEPQEKKVKIDEIESKDDIGSIEDEKSSVPLLFYEKMIENVNKTKDEIRKKLYPKLRLKVKRLLKQAKKVTIDLNVNIRK